MLRTVLVGGFLAATLAVANAAPITYDVVLNGGTGNSATGTITTDGKIGDITASDILGWQFDIVSGAGTATVSSAASGTNTFVGANPGGFTATAAGLYVNFALGASIQLYDVINASINGVLISSGYNNGGGFQSYINGQTEFTFDYVMANPLGTAEIAATPLPASWAMMLPVFAFGGMMLYRRRNEMGV